MQWSFQTNVHWYSIFSLQKIDQPLLLDTLSLDQQDNPQTITLLMQDPYQQQQEQISLHFYLY